MKSSIVFKGQKLTRTVVKNNIKRIWNLTTEEERYDWYLEANQFVLNHLTYGLTKEEVERSHAIGCGVLAALSPVKTWSQNKKEADSMIWTGDCGHMEQFKDKARRIMDSDGSDEEILSILRGAKISSFYLNIKYPDRGSNVTIDRWALRIALNKHITDSDYSTLTQNQYNWFAEVYCLAAVELYVSPLVLQSATWVHVRKNKVLKT